MYYNITTMTSLRIAQWNIENLFVYMDGSTGENLDNLNENQWQSLSTASVKNKSLKKLKLAKEVIFDISPDILMLNEVGGEISLRNFKHYFLDDQFQSRMIEGNSDRGIDVAYLIRKGLKFKTHIITHKNRPIPLSYDFDKVSKRYYFSRDVSELHLHDEESNELKLILLLTHLKSKLDPDHIDPLGKLRREAEVKALVEIYNEASDMSPQVPIVVGGDFNGCVQKAQLDPEYTDLMDRTDLIDVFDICTIDENRRNTQIQFPKYGNPLLLQLDYIFVSKALENRVNCNETYSYRFKDNMGQEAPLPTSYFEKQELPSDHYPVVTSINI